MTSSVIATISLTANTTVNSLVITDALNAGTAYERTLNIGNYSLSINGNFSITNRAINRPARDIVTISSNGSLTVGGNFTFLNSNSSTRVNYIIINNSGNLTVNGNTVINTKNGTTNSYVSMLVGMSPASYTFNGDVTLDDNTSTGSTSSYVGLGGLAAGSTGSFVFKENLIVGPFGTATTNSNLVTFLFDGISNQTITDNGYYWYFLPGNLTIGSSNNPSTA